MGRTHPNLLAHYRLENSLQDSSGNVRPTASGGSLSHVEGVYGRGINFGGASTYLTADIGVLGTQSITLTAWIKWTGITGDYQNIGVVFSDRLSPNPRFFLAIESGSEAARGRFRLVRSSPEGAFYNVGSTATVPENTWAYVAMVRSGQNWKVYLDSILVIDNSTPVQISFDNQTVSLSRDSEVNCLVFDADDWQIWNAALAPHQIAAIYNGVDPAFLGDVE
jgi:hypothetical protein